jgi:hypothetical protein
MQPTLSQTSFQTEANRANAQLSTGPKTDTGKKRASLNAHRHGLTGQAMILSAEELAAYKHHCEVFRKQHQPASEYENILVQILADTTWRLLRVPAIEAGILAHGRGRRGKYISVEDAELRHSLATASEFRNQAKALANITLYEQRLTRQFERTLAQLQALQSERRNQPENQGVAATNGFVFSNQDRGAAFPGCSRPSGPPSPSIRPSEVASPTAGFKFSGSIVDD